MFRVMLHYIPMLNGCLEGKGGIGETFAAYCFRASLPTCCLCVVMDVCEDITSAGHCPVISWPQFCRMASLFLSTLDVFC